MIGKFVFFFIICLTLPACIKQNVADNILMPIVVGIDKGNHDTLEYSLNVPLFQANQDVVNKMYMSTQNTIKYSRQLLLSESNKPISKEKISVVLFGGDLAENGLKRILDPILRDPRIARTIYLAVVDGEAKNLLDSDFSLKTEKGIFLHKMIEENIQVGGLPKTNVHKFEYNLLGKGMDPYLPLIEKYKDGVRISGLALFRKDRYVDKINLEEMQIFRLLSENVDHGIYQINLENKKHAVIENAGSKVSYDLGGTSERPEITINVKMKGLITEYSGFSLGEDTAKNIKKSFETQLVDGGNDLLKRFKQLQIDPLGLGDFVRSKTRNWKVEKWKQQYIHLPISIKVDANISGAGVTR